MKSEASEIFSNIFEGKKLDLSEQHVKNEIQKNPQLFEDQTVQLSNHYFQEWSENLLHLTNENLFDTSVHYFSIFTKVIDIIPSYFPPDSQIFLLIVQSFLNNIIKNNELMKNFCLSLCFKIQVMICSNNNSIDYSQIDLVITIFKSFHIVDIILEVITQYPFNFSKDIKYNPSKEVILYIEIAFLRYLLTQKIVGHILDSMNNIDNESKINILVSILHKVFNQLITEKISTLTINVNPPLGKLLGTPYLSWICDEYRIQIKEQKNSDQEDKESLLNSNNYKFNFTQLYEACGSYIYDEILKFSRDKNDDISHILYIIESLSQHYSRDFESTPGAMNYLESSIREALNDSRMKFDYNLAFNIDNSISNAFLYGATFWENFIAHPHKEEIKNDDNSNDNHHHHHDHCQCGFLFGNRESFARSALLHAVMRIENKSKFCAYLANSINSLTAAHGQGVIEIITPILDIIQLATGGNNIGLASSIHHRHEHHEHHEHEHHKHEAVNENDNATSGCCCECDSGNLWVEARLSFKGKVIPVFCDYLTYQIVNAIIDSGGCSLDEIKKAVKGNNDEIEDRVITLADYLLYLNDDDKYVFDSSYCPEQDFMRIVPFYEPMKGQISPEKHDLIKKKILAAIQTKGFEKLEFFIYDSFLMLNRKVRPDTAMILDMLDELVSDGDLELNDGIVKYIKGNEEEEK